MSKFYEKNNTNSPTNAPDLFLISSDSSLKLYQNHQIIGLHQLMNFISNMHGFPVTFDPIMELSSLRLIGHNG